jgi:prolyl 4-hydroxylase
MARNRRTHGAPLETRVLEADRLLVGDSDTPPEPKAAAALYVALAADGSGAAACRAAVLAAMGVGCDQGWEEALDFLALGARLGDRNARRQLALFAGRADDRVASGEAESEALWTRVRGEIDIAALLTPPSAQVVSSSPRILVIKGFAPAGFADWLIRRATGSLAPGEVNDAATGEVRRHEMRTAMAAPFAMLQRDVAVVIMQERAARATGLHLYQHEPPNVLRYLPGQRFEPHFDFIDPGAPSFAAELSMLGQRVATCITYLNDDFTGAETAFPELGWQFRGAPGDALIFFNVDAEGRPDRRTLHAGLPPQRGQKWILSQWLRDRGQPLV